MLDYDALEEENRRLREALQKARRYVQWEYDEVGDPNDRRVLERIDAALRQRADEATEAIRAKCEAIVLSRMNEADGSVHLACMNDVLSAIAALKDKP